MGKKIEKIKPYSNLIMLGALALVILVVVAVLDTLASAKSGAGPPPAKPVTMEPIGTIRKRDRNAWIEIDRRFEDGLLGIEEFSHVWVFWWFDRNDNPGKRGILQVHPKGDARNPLTGVFATRAPVRPNLIAMTLCKIRSIDKNIVRIEKIDAFDETAVLDLKPYIPGYDGNGKATVPSWIHRK